MEPRISIITLGVDDLDRSLRFYRDGLGFETSAEEGGILIASETYALVKDTILAEEQEPILVKGFAAPVRVFRVSGIYDDLEQEGRIIREQRDGVKILIDMGDNDRSKAVQVVEDVLDELKE